ncbi:MAG: rod shape-determining protein RodA [Candidatus Pacebacteria bacterium]|nr:rod shape-determining protein RodA [Candidatus Paceibacterota bacterium]
MSLGFLNHFKKFDWVLFFAALLLAIFGIVSLYGSANGDFSVFNRQAGFLIAAILALFGVSLVDNRNLRENPALLLVFYFVCVILLIGVFMFAPEIRGIKSWYRIGQISFDPIEPMKLILILILAKYFSVRHVELYNLKHIFLSGFYIALPVILIFFQPEFGSVAVVLAIWIGILLVSGIKVRDFLVMSLIFIVVAGGVWSFLLKDYQKDRVLSFVAPQEDLLGQGWSQNQSEISVGSGGLIGQGIGNGAQTQYGFLPEAHTDFAFASIAEETGLVGTLILLSLFILLFWRILKIALSARSNFSRLFASGLAISIFFQMAINVGMNLGLLPVIGLPLPLVSYGGSNLFFTFVSLGILENIKLTEA